MSRHLLSALATAVALLLSTGLVLANDPFRIVVKRIDADGFPTVRIVASVIDANGDPLGGLRAQDLQVRERNVPAGATVTLASLSSPVALVLVVDTSGSMSGRPLTDAKGAVASMISALGPNDQAAVLSFNTSVRVVAPLSGDKARALAAVSSLVAGGDTAIYDAVSSAAELLDSADPTARRAIVLLTDGLDTASRITRAAAIARVTGAALPVYAVALGDSTDRSVLQALAESSAGGAFYSAPTSGQLVSIYTSLARQIVTEYSVEFRSKATSLPDGASIPIELTVSRGGVVGRVAASYLVPAGRGAPRIAPTSVSVVPAALPTPEPVASSDDGSIPLVGLLGAMTALMFVLWLYELTLNVGSGQQRRIFALIRDAARDNEDLAKRSLLQRIAGPLRAIGKPVLNRLPSQTYGGARRRLELAGEPMTESEFIGLRIVSVSVLTPLVGLATYLVRDDTASGVIGAALGMAMGVSLPGLMLGSMARRRKSAIRRALVPSLDMLALSAEAGLAFDGGIAQVILRWRNPLSDELRRLLLEFQMGRERRQALRELARRTDLPDVARFVNAVIQADTLGVGLAKVLQDQALELRTKRRQRAEELARLAPVKMMFPMVLLIFPALFLIILGPAVPKITAIFNLH